MARATKATRPPDMLNLDPPLYLALPSAISTNNLFRNVKGRGRVKTDEYAKWQTRAAELIAIQRRHSFTMPVKITLFVGEVGIGNMDSDNTAKAPIDALKKAGVIRDDSRKWVRATECIWMPDMAGIVAEVRPAPPAPSPSLIVSFIPYGMREVLR